ncbi:hypothetical protein [Albimonas pacifica]|uniref:Uncharacterized protein n=1 Tax=Albimonas pacifica TaxID=1114924 RepID=A0A1I3H689_9RHOB|nr:hypothetical protein [Albimonas pacifica]SFI31236.1 hypothetical protein SAMN05216258_105523 [Albimonas pacifica]
MKASIVGPLGLGALAGIAGVAGAVGAGLPILGCLAAYSLCGAAGVLGGAVLNYRMVTAHETAHETRETETSPRVQAASAASSPRRLSAAG